MSDCFQFGLGSRAYQICSGESELSLAKTNRFRKMHGIEPLAGEDGPPATTNQANRQATAEVSVKRPPGVKSGCCGGGGKQKQAKAAKMAVTKPVSIVSRAIKYAESVAKHIADDNAPTSIDDMVFRKSKCDSCPFKENDSCKICGCYLTKNILNNGKLSWRSEQCPLGRWFDKNNNNKPLVNPTKNLLFHLYPRRGAEWNWKWHIEQIRKNADLFNGKICIGLSVGDETEKAESVQKMFDGIPVSNWLVVKNNKLAETLTFTDLLSLVKTDDENSVTMRGHTKGVTHGRGSVEQKWKELMWDACTDFDSVSDALSSHFVAGPMKCHEPLVSKQPYRWFYAGSFWWQRDKEVFKRDWQKTESSRWFSEYFPGMMFHNEEAACLLHDFAKGAILNDQYWMSEVQPEWNNWRASRGMK